MARRHEDWLAQAKRDLKAARDSLEDGNYEWSAFQAQQSAEKAIKALLRYHNIEATGHTILHLLKRAEEVTTLPDELKMMAQELDRHYIPPRYPNIFERGYPGEFYNEETARRCIDYAERFVDLVAAKIS